MSKPSALRLPTPLAPPAPIPPRHNATVYERALGVARGMADRHARGDYNTAADQQDINTIDGLIGHFNADARMVWPAEIVTLAGVTTRAAQ